MANPAWISATLALPTEGIQTVVDATATAADGARTVLEAAKTGLELVQSFSVALQNPQEAVLAALREQIEGLISDFRDLGIYVTFDDLQVGWPFEGLRGGFAGFERRMKTRLLNRKDPSRPNFSSATTTLALFFYTSVPVDPGTQSVAFWEEGLQLMQQVAGFFGAGPVASKRLFPTPAGLAVGYGSSSVQGFRVMRPLRELVVSDTGEGVVTTLQWTLAVPPGAQSSLLPLPAPPKFLVEVSTVPDGLLLVYEVMVPSETGGLLPKRGYVCDSEGVPVRIYGGAERILSEGTLDWTLSGVDSWHDPGATSEGALKPGGVRFYGEAVGGQQIPLNALKQGSAYIMQKSFVVEGGSLLGANPLRPGQPFAISLSTAEMPQDALIETLPNGDVRVVPSGVPAPIVYARVTAVGRSVSATNAFYHLTDTDIRTQASTAGGVFVTPAILLGESSDAIPVFFPGASTSRVQNTVGLSLALLALSRPDLGDTGLEDLAAILLPPLLGPKPAAYFSPDQVLPLPWRGDFFRRCVELAQDLLTRLGPLSPSQELLLLEQSKVAGKYLVDLTWADLGFDGLGEQSIWVGINPKRGYGDSDDQGIGPNPLVLGIPSKSRDYTLALYRLQQIKLERGPFLPHADSTQVVTYFPTDWCPVVYAAQGTSGRTVSYARNLLLGSPEVLTAIRHVLVMVAEQAGVATPVSGGSWRFVKYSVQGMPQLGYLLDNLAGSAAQGSASIQVSTKVLDAYIDTFESRIEGLEVLINRLQGLLQMIALLSLQQSVSVLLTTGEGTDGALASLLSAENKPADSLSDIGIGGAVVLGGVPTEVVALLTSMLTPEG